MVTKICVNIGSGRGLSSEPEPMLTHHVKWYLSEGKNHEINLKYALG